MNLSSVLTVALAVTGALVSRGLPTDHADERHAVLGDGWTRSQHDVLAGFRNMYHATVLQVDDAAYPFRMWFMGWAKDDCNPGFPGCDAIFFARGKNLDAWEVYAGDGRYDTSMTPGLWKPVLTPDDKPYDAWHNGDPSVVFRAGRYFMAYSATGPNLDGVLFGAPTDKDGDLYCVMGAVSDDGISWTRTAKPLLIYAPEVGATQKGENDAFLYGMYHRPSLLYDQGKWRLWFDYWAGDGVAMGYAEGDDSAFESGGFLVLKAGNDPMLREWPNPSVVKVGRRYVSYADPSGYGQGWPGRQLAEAVSPDGLHWTVTGYFPPDTDTPACHVPAATVVRQDGAEWLVVFYACQIGGAPAYDYRYDRIRYMKRKQEVP